MAAFNFKFALLVAFLVVFIGQGLISDAKPIERKEDEDDKEATTEVAPASEDSADEADEAEDSSTRSKIRKHKSGSAYEKCKRRYKGQKKKIDKNCKREFNLKGAIRPFDNEPGRYLDGPHSATENFSPDDRSEDEGNYEDYEDGGPSDSFKGFHEESNPKVAHKNSSSIKEDEDEDTIEQQILEAEGEQRHDTKAGATDGESEKTNEKASEKASEKTSATPSDDEHDEGEMREINGGCYDHHSSDCPNLEDQIMNGHENNFHGTGAIGAGPSGQSFHCGCAGAGHLATYINNDTNTPCAPNMNCANVCGNINMGLPHPECQTSMTQDKLREEATKSYSPSCKLININGNVGLSLPHPCIQLTDDQKCSTQSCATVGTTCAGCNSLSGNLCGLGRDDVSQKNDSSATNATATKESSNTSGESPAAATASLGGKGESDAGEEDGSESEDAKLVGTFDHHHDGGQRLKRNAKGAREETGCHRRKRDCCCDPHYLYHGNELQIVGTACQGVDCHEGGNLQRVLPHPEEQLNGHHYPGCCDCLNHCGHNHVHNPLPHHIQEEMNCCDGPHGHRCMLHCHIHGADGHHHQNEFLHCGCHGCCHGHHGGHHGYGHGGHGGHHGCCHHHCCHDHCCHDHCCHHHDHCCHDCCHHHGDHCCHHHDHHGGCCHDDCCHGEHPGPHGHPDTDCCCHDYKRISIPYKTLKR